MLEGILQALMVVTAVTFAVSGIAYAYAYEFRLGKNEKVVGAVFLISGFLLAIEATIAVLAYL